MLVRSSSKSPGKQENISPVFQQKLQNMELLRIQLCPKRSTLASLSTCLTLGTHIASELCASLTVKHRLKTSLELFVLSTLQEQAGDKHQIPAAALATHPVCFQTHSYFFFFFSHPRQQLLWEKMRHSAKSTTSLAMGFGRGQTSPFRLTLRSAGPRCAQDSLYPNICTTQSTATPLDKKIITFLTFIARLTRNKAKILLSMCLLLHTGKYK